MDRVENYYYLLDHPIVTSVPLVMSGDARTLIFRIVGVVVVLNHVVRPKEIYNLRSPAPPWQELGNKKGEPRDTVLPLAACPVCRQRGSNRTASDGAVAQRGVLSRLQA